MLSCKEATRLVSEGLDRELPLWKRFGLRMHVMLCRACSRYKRQVDSLNKLISEHYRGDPPVGGVDDPSAAVLDRMKTALRTECSPPEQDPENPHAV